MDGRDARQPVGQRPEIVERAVAAAGERGAVDITLVRQVEGELQTGDDVALGRREIVVLGVGIHADLEGDVVQRSVAEGLGAEHLVEAEGRAEQAVDFVAPSHEAGIAALVKLVWMHAGVGAGIGRIIVIRLEHRDGEEVGAVLPEIEMREGVDLLGGGAVDAAVADRENAGVRALGHPGERHAVIDQQEERQIGRLWQPWSGRIGRPGQAGRRKRSQCQHGGCDC